MKRIIVIAGILMFSSCTVERTVVQPAPPATEAAQVIQTTPAPTPNTYQTASAEDLYLAAIEQVYGQPVYVSNSDLLDTGYLTCDGLDAGQTIDDLLNVITSAASNEDSLNFLTIVAAAAITFLCPWHEDLLDTGANGI